MGGFLALSAMTRVGRGVVDAIRQVEVTRHNARTEYFYQLHNWVVQDPNFHWAAETIGLKYELDPLQSLLNRYAYQLPTLQAGSPLYTTIANKVKTTRENMGRRSAPPYFPMTPMVGLVDARG